MIRNVFKAALAVAAMTTAGQAFAQVSAQQSTTGSTTIVAPITLTKNADLAFGSVTRPVTGSSTVTLTPAGTLSATNGAAVAGGTATPAAFTVNGQADSNYSITLGSLSMVNGANSIPVTLTGSKASGTLTGGTDTFKVGGSFTIADNQALGVYSGSFNVTVAYN